MTDNCRICGDATKGTCAKSLFTSAQIVFLHRIELLTGEWLNYKKDLPAYICICCEQDLIVAASFRDRCIRTQNNFRENLLDASSDDITQQKTKELITITESDDQEFEDLCYIDDPDNLILNEDDYENNQMLSKDKEIITYTETDEREFAFLCKRDDRKLLLSNEDNPENHQSQNNDHNKNFGNNQPRTTDPLPKESETIVSATALKIQQILSKSKSSRRKYISWKNLSDEEASLLKRLQRERDCICEQCGKHFKDSSNFKLHLLRHTGVKNYECETCNAKFYTSNLLKRHKMLHLGIPLYRCQYCERTFNFPHLKLEHERAHRNEAPLQCNFCDKRFRSSALRKDHELVHTRIRKYHCEPCNQSFMRCSHLRQHQLSKSHHKNKELNF